MDSATKTISEDGFALVIVMVVIAALSASAIPLLGTVNRNQESTVAQQVTARLTVEARENLEMGVHMAKLAGGVPGYFTNSYSSDATQLANACETRLMLSSPTSSHRCAVAHWQCARLSDRYRRRPADRHFCRRQGCYRRQSLRQDPGDRLRTPPAIRHQRRSKRDGPHPGLLLRSELCEY